MSLTTGNIFAALADPKKAKGSKKKSSKDNDKKKKPGDKKAISAAELEAAIFAQPAANFSSWADEDDDDDTWAAPVSAARALCPAPSRRSTASPGDQGAPDQRAPARRAPSARRQTGMPQPRSTWRARRAKRCGAAHRAAERCAPLSCGPRADR
jgi:hypothetical protein